ncbi:hypothetical protein Tco_0149006 [Tanacetum coccineum]
MRRLDEIQSEIDSIMMNLGTYIPEPLVNSNVYKERDDDIEVTLDEEQFLSDHYTAHVTPHAYTPSLPFLATMEPTNTLLMGDEVISTTPKRENDEFTKSSVDDLVPILRESEVTSVCDDLECDMPVNTPLPTIDLPMSAGIDDEKKTHGLRFLVEDYMQQESSQGSCYFYIRGEEAETGIISVRWRNKEEMSRLIGDYVLCLTAGIRMIVTAKWAKRSMEPPIRFPQKLRSYDVTVSNPLFDFNDDFTLCNDNLLFDEEFGDISSLDPPKSAPLNHEPLGNPDSVSRSLETSDLILEELTAEISLDDSIPTEIDDGYYDSEGDILFLEQLLIEETFFDPTSVVLPKKSTLLVTPPPASKQLSLWEVERFDTLFSLTQSVGRRG